MKSRLLTLGRIKSQSSGNLKQISPYPDWLGIPENYHERLGFVYRITCLANKRTYIGKKQFYSSTGKKAGRLTRKESDWRKYFGSSKEVVADFKKYGKENFKREILECFDSKCELALAELAYQLHYAIQDPLSYNSIVNLRLFIRPSMKLMRFPWQK